MPYLQPRKCRLARIAEAIDANPARALVALSVLYFAVAFMQAWIRLLWFDEFITFYIAKLNSAAAVWAALARGVDPNPPLTHLLVMWSMRLFGEHEVAVRLPSLLAGWTGIVCLFYFLRRHVTALYAAAGVAYFLGTAGFTYSYDGRSYALMLASSMSSLLAWRVAVEGRRRTLATGALALALAVGISSNYYAVLAFFPIAAGELVSIIESRIVRWHIWFALAVGATPLAFYLPLIRYSIAQFSPHAWNKPHPMVMWESYEQMVAINLIPACAIFAAGLYQYATRTEPRVSQVRVLPREETVALAVLMLYPVLGYTVAVLRAGMISPRFVLPVCYGFAVATAITSFKLFSRSRIAGAALLVILTALFLAREGVFGYWFYHQRLAVYRVRDRLPATNVAVVSDSLLVLPLHYYSRPDIASRIVFPIDFTAVRKYKGEDSPEQNLWAGRSIFPVPIVPLAEFQQRSPDYLIVTTQQNWLVQKLDHDGIPAQQLAITTDTEAIGGFFPLSHGQVYYFEERDTVARLAARSHDKIPINHVPVVTK